MSLIEPTDILKITATLALGFATTYALTPWISSMMSRRGIVGVDIHKLDRPSLPEMCGVSIVLGLIASTTATGCLYPNFVLESAAFGLCISIAGAIGGVDGLRPLDPRVKPILTALACIPILALGVYQPHPSLPFIGMTRLTIIYILLIPFAIAVPANAVNMMDVFNGSMTGTCGIASAFLIVCMIFAGRIEAASLGAGLLGSLIAFHRFNRYRAKVFAGDLGDLSVGAAIGAIAIIGRVEVAAVVALMPHIMNAFYSLTTLGGPHERRQISSRPTKLLADGRLDASSDPAAPVTLARIILSEGPLSEANVVKTMMILTTLCSILAVVTALLTPW